jgi:hypothetical protein
VLELVVFSKWCIEKFRNAVVVNEKGHLGMSQVLSQHEVNPTALWTRDEYISCLLAHAL